MDPRENPIYIQHAFENKGIYPPEFGDEFDRFLEDIDNTRELSKKKEKPGSRLIKLTRMVGRERQKLVHKFDKYNLNQNLETLGSSGKPFYWVEIEKLRKMKQFCEK